MDNGDREVFFQEASGALQRALYSSRSDSWRTSVDSVLVSGAKNNTPLAVSNVQPLPDGQRGVRSLSLSVGIFYVTPANNLDCLIWAGSSSANCSELALPSIEVSPDARAISAHWITTIDTSTIDSQHHHLLLQYHGPSGQIVSILGISNFTYSEGTRSAGWTWSWHDWSDTLNVLLKRSYQTLDKPYEHKISRPCNGYYRDTTTYTMACFLTKSAGALFHFAADTGSQANATITTGITFSDDSFTNYRDVEDGSVSTAGDMLRAKSVVLLDLSSPSYYPPSSSPDIISLAPSPNYYMHDAFLNDTILSGTSSGTPNPDSGFPYHRLAGTLGTNQTKTYLYHQLDGTTLAEDMWDGDETGFWISKNITIDTELIQPHAFSPDPAILSILDIEVSSTFTFQPTPTAPPL
ncbi:MAG: hypothetical protein Q9174_002813 [Haloplaca sp. 1 TL-2023]